MSDILKAIVLIVITELFIFFSCGCSGGVSGAAWINNSIGENQSVAIAPSDSLYAWGEKFYVRFGSGKDNNKHFFCDDLDKKRTQYRREYLMESY